MSITWTNEGADSAAKLSTLGTPTWTHIWLRLTTTNHTPGNTDTWGANPYTETTLTGYAAIDLTTLSPTLTQTAGVATYTYPTQTFTFSGGGTATIYGYYLEIVPSSGGPWLWGAELFASSYTATGGVGSISCTPTWSNGGQ
jgi:hypothetical protein